MVSPIHTGSVTTGGTLIHHNDRRAVGAVEHLKTGPTASGIFIILSVQSGVIAASESIDGVATVGKVAGGKSITGWTGTIVVIAGPALVGLHNSGRVGTIGIANIGDASSYGPNGADPNPKACKYRYTDKGPIQIQSISIDGFHLETQFPSSDKVLSYCSRVRHTGGYGKSVWKIIRRYFTNAFKRS
jgi:hypothetical protein